MKFLVDNQLPAALARFIEQDLKTESVHVQDVNLDSASDADVWAYASRHNLTLITKDEDFVALFSKDPTANLLWVRLRNCRRVELLQAFERAWPRILNRFGMGERFVEFR